MATGHKVKTHKGARKRFKFSSNGKLMFKKNGSRHLLTSKNRKRKRSLREEAVVVGKVAANVRQIMPYA